MRKRPGHPPAPSWRDTCLQAQATIRTMESELAAKNQAIERLQQEVADLHVHYGEKLATQQTRTTAQLAGIQTGYDQETRQMLLEIIEITDAFANLFNRLDPQLADTEIRVSAWSGNFRTIYKMLVRALQRCDVALVPVEPGMLADPDWHHVIETIPDPTQPDETIVEIIKPGYQWRGSLLRAAEVRTIRNT